ncbi:hypothetical protein [Microbacterium deminutum]|uniref:Uncharacterized protein n=1 Tax=Microbacterium deminutum TaxID=344164 RepID=A0ABP5C6J6_9MICO
MTTTTKTVSATTAETSSGLTRLRWHGPLIALAATMAVTGLVSIVGLLLDDRELVGAPIWAKPFKFSVSVLIYAVTWAWLIGQLRRFRRTAWWAGTVISVALFIEMAAVLSQTVRGARSHFNQSTPYDGFVWSVMGATIAVLWLATLVAAILLWFSPYGDRARNLAVRLGAGICLVGLSLGFLMTIPSQAQIAAGGDIVGAHTVGAIDGGPGIPILNWSTEHGDLRIPHFVGMHALQLIPLALIMIELASRRVGVLRDLRVRVGLVWTTAVVYVSVVALVLWQALRGQSIVQPDGATLLAAGGIALVGTAGVALTLALGRTREREPRPRAR